MCRILFPLHPHFSTLRAFVVVQRSAHDLKLRVLVMHRSFHISVAHGLHYSSQIPSSHKNPSAVVMPRAIQDQAFGKAGFRPRLAKQSICRAYVATRRPGRWKNPPFLFCAAAFSQNLDYPSTHRNEPSPFRCLAVRNENQPVFPVEILDAHPVEFALISHSGIAHQNNDVTKEIVSFLSPLATKGRREQFLFRVIIESQ